MAVRAGRWLVAPTLALRLVVFGLALAVLAPLGHSARAATPDSVVYFPWAPNGETLDGSGPWRSELSFQNLNGSTCPMSVYVGADGNWIRQAQLSLRANESRSVSSSTLAVPNPGAPLRLEAQCPIAASLKQTTPAVLNAPWSDGAQSVTGYTAIARADIDASRGAAGAAWFLPIVQTNSGWNTLIRVANLSGNSSADVTMELYPSGNTAGADGVAKVLTTRLPVAGTWAVDALQQLSVTGWVGYARISANREIAAIAVRTKPEAGLSLTNVAVAADAGLTGANYVSGAPLLFNAYNGWNTGINLANVSDSVATVTVAYYPVAGEQLRQDLLTLAPRSMRYIYTPGNVPKQGFVGSATIRSDAPVVAAIDEVKYETTEGLSYMAGSVAQTDGAIPLVFREDPALGLRDNSGINISNLNLTTAQTARIQLYSDVGAPLLSQPFSLVIPPGGNNYVYLPFLNEAPAGTVASARVTASDPAGLVVISNDVNYAVSGDGSVVFVASGTTGYYHLEPS